MADKYCIIDICPNRICKFDSPIMILFSFKICTYGKWYNPASGLFILLNAINKKTQKEENNKKLKSFFNNKFSLSRKKNGIIKIIVAIVLFKGKKKLINRAKKETKIAP